MTRIRSRTQLIQFLELQQIQISQYMVKQILEYMYQGLPTYITTDGRVLQMGLENRYHLVLQI